MNINCPDVTAVLTSKEQSHSSHQAARQYTSSAHGTVYSQGRVRWRTDGGKYREILYCVVWAWVYCEGNVSVPRVYNECTTTVPTWGIGLVNSDTHFNGTAQYITTVLRQTDRQNHEMKHICCLYSYLTSAHIHLPFYPHNEQTVTNSASQLPTVPV